MTLPPNAAASLKSVALKSGAAVCGVADAAAFAARAPDKQRPDDLLPGARSVVVVGGAQPREGDWAATSPWVLQTMGTTERIQGVGRRAEDARLADRPGPARGARAAGHRLSEPLPPGRPELAPQP
jgi:hypothetical protein